MIGESAGLKPVIERVHQVAPTDAPVLLLGETGSGKEVIARVHPRAVAARERADVVRVNCGAIPSELVDSRSSSATSAGRSPARWATPQRLVRARGRRHAVPRRDRRAAARGAGAAPARAPGQHASSASAATRRFTWTSASSPPRTAHLRDRWWPKGRFREDLWYRLERISRFDCPPLRDRHGGPAGARGPFRLARGQAPRRRPLTPTAADIELIRRVFVAGQRARARVRDRARGDPR